MLTSALCNADALSIPPSKCQNFIGDETIVDNDIRFVHALQRLDRKQLGIPRARTYDINLPGCIGSPFEQGRKERVCIGALPRSENTRNRPREEHLPKPSALVKWQCIFHTLAHFFGKLAGKRNGCGYPRLQFFAQLAGEDRRVAATANTDDDW